MPNNWHKSADADVDGVDLHDCLCLVFGTLCIRSGTLQVKVATVAVSGR